MDTFIIVGRKSSMIWITNISYLQKRKEGSRKREILREIQPVWMQNEIERQPIISDRLFLICWRAFDNRLEIHMISYVDVHMTHLSLFYADALLQVYHTSTLQVHITQQQ